MNKLKFKTINDKKVYEIPDDVCRELIKRGDDHKKNTFPNPGNGYSVSLLTEDGNFYEGASYGSDTWTLTMHSEASALAHAANHGETKIVAITGPNCHICKQLIYESSLRSGIDTVIVSEEQNKIKQTPISKLMPEPWPEKPTM